jgi:hypothetical protein
MNDLELTRSPDDRRLYALQGVGTLRLEGWASRRAIAETGGHSWRITGRGFWQPVFEVADAAGAAVGSFEPYTLRRGGAVRWNGRELRLRPATRWNERYALADDDRELVTLEGKVWGRRPVKVTVDDPGSFEPGLLLFTAFIVRSLASESSGLSTV